eukprot:8051392-Pyramimonas_sp.AAC.1
MPQHGRRWGVTEFDKRRRLASMLWGRPWRRGSLGASFSSWSSVPITSETFVTSCARDRLAPRTRAFTS